MTQEWGALLGEAIGRGAVYFPALVSIGTVCCRFWLAPRASRDIASSASWRQQLPVLERWGLLSALVLVVGVGLRAVAQTINSFGVRAAFDLEALRVIVVDSRWGGRWQWQLWAAMALVAGQLLMRFDQRCGQFVAVLGSLGFCLALPLTGHAVSHGGWARLSQTVHVFGACLWVGTLSALVPFAIRTRREGAREVGRAFLRAFAPLATFGLVALAVSGTVTATLYLPSLSTLWTSRYGWTLLAKVGLFAVVGAIGAANHRRLRSVSVDSLPTRTLWAEWSVACCVLGLTAALTGQSPPM